MLPPTPPNVTKFGSYTIELTCQHLGCCRDILRDKTSNGKIIPTTLDDGTIAYQAIEILRYWFNATKQPRTDRELNALLDSIAKNGYEQTFGCPPPPLAPKPKPRVRRKAKKECE